MRYNVIDLCGFVSALIVAVNADIGNTNLGGQSALGSGVMSSSDGMIQGGIPTGLGQGLGSRRLGGLQTGMGIGNGANFGRRLDR